MREIQCKADQCSDTASTSRRRDTRRVTTADEIETRLGPRDDHIRVLMLGQGKDALELQVPYVTLPILRPGHVPADWVRGVPEKLEPNEEQTALLRILPPLSKDAAERIRQLGD